MAKTSSSSEISHCYYSEESPQFFKIFLPHGCSQRISIPLAFIKKYLNGVSPPTSILRVTNYPSKRLWRIGINKVDKHLFFKNGWPQFVRDNSLEKGDFLIFSYAGNSKYYVTVFGLNNCPKIFPIADTTDNEDEQQELPRNQDTVKPHMSKERMYADNDGVVETPNKLSSKKPAFESVMKSSYVLTGQMYIPLDFMRSYVTTNDTTATLTHLDKSWVVKLKHRSHGVILCGRWKKFVEDNNLEEGDVCRFELIQRDDYVLDVAIFRRNGTKTAQDTSKERMHADNIVETPTKLSSKKPAFERVMKSSYVLTGQMYIPSDFVRSYITTNDTTATLNHSDKPWAVNLKHRSHGVVLSGGWKKFVEDNNLEEGDVCRFELIQRDDYVFNVAICRGNGTSKTGHGSK